VKKLLSIAILTAGAFSANAEISFSGFASINAGKVLSGTGVPQFGLEPTFLADYPLVSAYTEEFSFKPETLIGLQAYADLSNGLSATAQIVARGTNDFDATFEWAYVSYEINDNWTVQAGKKRLPLFYYSDFFDVGYAYPWMRAPADNYTWQIFNYNGINAQYTDNWGDWSITGEIYGGREDSEDNKLLSTFFFSEPTKEIWKDIVGGVFLATYDWLELRATHMRYTNERFRSGEQVLWDGSPERDGKFYGLAANVDMGDWFVLSERNRLTLQETDLDSLMLTLGVRLDAVTLFTSYSELEEDILDGENHNTTSVGGRWDFHPSAAFKLQWDKVKDKSFDLAVAGDSKSVTVGIDLIF